MTWSHWLCLYTASITDLPYLVVDFLLALFVEITIHTFHILRYFITCLYNVN